VIEEILDFVLTAPAEAPAAADLAAWWSERVQLAGSWETPVDAAIARALGADRIGYAFAPGYHAALRTLVPVLPDNELVAFCATEQGGAHPRAIRTSLVNGELTGEKRWSTFATAATNLLVVASLGLDAEERNRLCVVRVSARAPGVVLRRMPETPFAPEIPHAEASFQAVRVAAADVLPGDGYTEYLRPFRTIEDVHVHAVLIAYLISVARRSSWPRAVLERLTAALVTARALALAPPSRPAVHVALAGLVESTNALLSESAEHWKLVEAAESERWQRDAPLGTVAARARAARLESAWQKLATSHVQR
jgi:alkylation response protein AidB-like acyl-CoA dehydrogenase